MFSFSVVFHSFNCALILIQVRAESVGDQTVLAQIVSEVQKAQSQKAPIQAFADKVAGVFVPVVVSLSILTTCSWYLCLVRSLRLSSFPRFSTHLFPSIFSFVCNFR